MAAGRSRRVSRPSPNGSRRPKCTASARVSAPPHATVAHKPLCDSTETHTHFSRHKPKSYKKRICGYMKLSLVCARHTPPRALVCADPVCPVPTPRVCTQCSSAARWSLTSSKRSR
eukprot:5993357-Prymnesium_polylepis.1